MKLPEPKQLPSGAWRIQVYVDGKRTGRTFPTYREALQWGAQIKTGAKEAKRSPSSLTVKQAIERYIQTKDAILSPSTIYGYKKILKNQMQPITSVQLDTLTQDAVQRWVNDLSRHLSPKSVRNAHGLLAHIMAVYRPDFVLRTAFPPKVKHEIQIPTEEELAAIVEQAKGTKYELGILLAACLGLRESEVLGITWKDVGSSELRIRQAVVYGENGPVRKGTKSYAGTRTLHVPDYLLPYLQKPEKAAPEDPVVPLTANALYKGFIRICKKCEITGYRFHDLRHVHASVMQSLGIPNTYAKERMGHATDNMLRTVYQHTQREKTAAYDKSIDDYFSNVLSIAHEIAHDK